MERKIRKPSQKRALEKFDKIIEAAFKLFNEKGYYSTTTADIAAEANVATGSIYAYFKDKKDIYMQVLEKIDDNFSYPTTDFWLENNDIDLKNPTAVKSLFKAFIKVMMKYHNFSETFQHELEALKLLDEEIGKSVNERYDQRISRIIDVLNELNMDFKSNEDMQIFCHYINLLIDDICHKILYDNTVIDVDLYMERCADLLYSIFVSTTNLK